MTLARDLLIRATAGEDVIFFAGPVRARSLRLDLGEGGALVTCWMRNWPGALPLNGSSPQTIWNSETPRE